MTSEEMGELLVDLGGDQRCGRRLFKALFARGRTEFAELADLRREVRQGLAAQASLALPQIVDRQLAADGTRKYKLRTADGRGFEAVYLPAIGGARTHTLCISSQTGCAVGCTFCFTASIVRHRNLTAAELVGQVMAVLRDLHGHAPRPTNVVFMGMGEPLHNYRHVVQAARILMAPDGLNLSRRRVTLSTAGVVPRLRQLGQELPLQLAVSLNATTDAQRSAIMPINRRWPLAELLAALRAYPVAPRQRITVEYVLLAGHNDSLDDARRLAGLLQGIPAQVNLLPLNPHARTPHRPPAPAQVRAFQRTLRGTGLHALVRTPRGQDIAAACGQLGEG